eukprot:scaffold213455_cov33-Prasinocladus_malaysianus.AAC.1
MDKTTAAVAAAAARCVSSLSVFRQWRVREHSLHMQTAPDLSYKAWTHRTAGGTGNTMGPQGVCCMFYKIKPQEY